MAASRWSSSPVPALVQVGGGGGRGCRLEARLEEYDGDAHVVAAAQLEAVVDERAGGLDAARAAV